MSDTKTSVVELHPLIAEDMTVVTKAIDEALSKLAGSTVMVAGAAGFLPSHVVDALAFANQGAERPPIHVLCVDNFKTGVPERLAHLENRADVSFVEHDITQPLPGSLAADYIVHAASIASPTWYRRFPLETIDINVVGTRHLLDLAREGGCRGFVYLSSSEIYGDPPPERIPTTEDYWGHVSSLGPRACYDESKRLAETLCMIYARSYDVPVKIMRPFNVYGPRLRLDDGRIVPDIISAVLEHEPITLYSDGRATRSFCYVRDAAAGIVATLAAETSGEAFNLGNDEEVTIKQLAELFDEVSGNGAGVRLEVSDDPEYVTDNPQRRCPDLSKIKRIVGWAPAVPLREGIDRTLRYYREGGR